MTQDPSTTSVSCPICYETVQEPYVTPCTHVFCVSCARRWYEHATTCPVCRFKNAFLLPALSSADDRQEPRRHRSRKSKRSRHPTQRLREARFVIPYTHRRINLHTGEILDEWRGVSHVYETTTPQTNLQRLPRAPPTGGVFVARFPCASFSSIFFHRFVYAIVFRTANMRYVDARSLYKPCSAHATERACLSDPRCTWFDPTSFAFPITEARPTCTERWSFFNEDRRALAEWGFQSGAKNYEWYTLSSRRNDTNDSGDSNDTSPNPPPPSTPAIPPEPVPSPRPPSESPDPFPVPEPSSPPLAPNRGARIGSRYALGLLASGLVAFACMR